MPDRIFIAHAGQDSAFTGQIKSHLEQRGYEVRVDNGSSIEQRITVVEYDIRQCHAYLVVVSDHTVRAGFVERLTRIAFVAKKPVLAVRRTRQRIAWLAGAPSVNVGNQGIPQVLVKKVISLIKESRKKEMTDITDRDDLIRYAIRAQLYRVASSVEEVSGNGTGVDGPELTAFLDGTGSISIDTLRALDEAVVAIGHAGGRTHIGGLAQFASRIGDPTGHMSGYTRLPPDWTTETLRADSDDEIHVLVQASTLINEFLTADRVGLSSAAIRERHREALTPVVDRLILMANGLQSARHNEAQLLLARLARYAFDSVRRGLSASIRRSPLGFRSWRSVTHLVLIARLMEAAKNPEHARLVSDLRQWLLQLADEAEELRYASLYPGRSLDLELFITVPWDWGISESTDLMTKALMDRARNGKATIRERGTAAMGLWQRACENQRASDAKVRSALGELIESFHNDTSDAAEGLRWVATTLRHAMDEETSVCATLPRSEEPWYQAVEGAAAALGRGWPESIVRPTRDLFRHALLQNSGVVRRRAIEALAAGGLVEPVTHQLFALLEDRRRVGAWLRIRALFAAGFMQARSDESEDELVRVTVRAAKTVMHGGAERAEVTELQEALFAVADTFGVTGVEDRDAIARAGLVRNRLRDVLIELVEHEHTKEIGQYPVARALTYLLLFTAQQQPPGGAEDLSRRLLSNLAQHDDEVTQEFSNWVLRFRWGSDGALRPLLRGVKDAL